MYTVVHSIFMLCLHPSWGDILFSSCLPITTVVPFGDSHIITAVWSDHFLKSYCSCWLVEKNVLYVQLIRPLHFEWDSILCILAYYHIENHMLVRQMTQLFLWSYCPFWLRNISSRSWYMQLHLHFKWKFLKASHTWLYGNM